MKSFEVVVIAVILSVSIVDAFIENSFEQIMGCKQYNSGAKYHGAIKYFPTANMRHVGHTNQNSKFFKFAIFGPSDGLIRYGKTVYPYDSDGIEIVLGGWGNTKSAGRRQRRTASHQNVNTLLAEAPTPYLMSQYGPIMFVLEVFTDGLVKVRRYGQSTPFLSFNDSNRTPVDYMAFAKGDKDLIFFYDCPLGNPNRADALK
ncbi:uncharacterized protein LOC128713157 [Anopheles marshallii]|uniref:uncharacterized protein LOC128713157 n=1 Tax=Anopheles marshallii TaxID=1521116 RepID=UPI00237B2B7D|nr:uncharacterized protein LOC128713157 [Anopheles marshallii]